MSPVLCSSTMTILIHRMESELTIVSEESRELADALEEREMELLLKVRKQEAASRRRCLAQQSPVL